MTTVLRECFQSLRDGWISSQWPVVVAATTTDVEKVPTGVLGLFKEEIALEVSVPLGLCEDVCLLGETDQL